MVVTGLLFAYRSHRAITTLQRDSVKSRCLLDEAIRHRPLLRQLAESGQTLHLAGYRRDWIYPDGPFLAVEPQLRLTAADRSDAFVRRFDMATSRFER